MSVDALVAVPVEITLAELLRQHRSTGQACTHAACAAIKSVEVGQLIATTIFQGPNATVEQRTQIAGLAVLQLVDVLDFFGLDAGPVLERAMQIAMRRELRAHSIQPPAPPATRTP
jgi:hypothetical protein